MKDDMMNNKTLIHKKYKKGRLMVLGLLLFTISFMTVGYSSNISSLLESIGYVSLSGSVGNLEIISIDMVSTVNATSNETNFYISSESTESSSILVAEFDINYYRTQGSNVTSAVYEVTIKNNSLKSRTLTSIDSNATFGTNTSSLNYKMTGCSVGTTILPGESLTVSLEFSLSQSIRNTSYDVNEVFKFEFSDVSNNSFKLIPTLETTSLEFNDISEMKPISISVINNSSFDATYTLSINNSNFELVDSDGNGIGNLSITSSSKSSVLVYLKISNNHFFDSLNYSLSISLDTTSPSIINYNLGKISVVVPDTGIYQMISNSTVYDDTTIDFTSTSTTTGLYKNTSSGEVTYFYRGNVTNNYVSFAGYNWRIIKIDKYGVRVVLDSIIDTQSQWGTNPGTSATLADAISVLTYDNSPVKTIVDSWYSSNLSSYSSLIKPTLFCLDESYQTMSSSGNGGVTVYYFGSYIRNGKDSAGYTPEFTCSSEYVREYNVGLISGDEVAFAGGVFNTNNTSYYLYNSSISSNWWTLSPSYFDSSLGTVGMLVVNGSNGKFYDWPNGSTIENSMGIRPVITLDTDKLSGGNGTSSNKYTFG